MSTKILVVEDDQTLRDSMKEFIELTTKAVVLTAAGMEEVANSPSILDSHLAILDINLGPEQPDGIAVCNWLKQNGFEGKIVFLTGHSVDSSFSKEAAGFEGVLILRKPVDTRLLIDLVEQTK